MKYRLKSWDELANDYPVGKAGSLEHEGPTYTRTMDDFRGMIFEHDFRDGNFNLVTGHAVAEWMVEKWS